MTKKMVAGVDEAGRGPLAGPVVAAACILPENHTISGITDSKKLSAIQRAHIFSQLIEVSVYSIAVIEPEEIDRINILKATLEAMRQAIDSLPIRPDEVLIDGPHTPFVTMPCEGIVKGDLLYPCISAASIIAKETRDKVMREYHTLWPQYNFDQHKGYGTARHLKALSEHGISPIHRKSFSPVKKYVSSN